jgi:hypothetical protein
MPEPRFKVGDQVRWWSAASGGDSTKVGVVFRVVPPGEVVTHHLAAQYLEAFQGNPVATWKTDFGRPRKMESYLVVVPKQGRKGPVVYWPRTSALEAHTDE